MNSTGHEVVWLHRHDGLYEEEFYMTDFVQKLMLIFPKTTKVISPVNNNSYIHSMQEIYVWPLKW